MTNFKYVGVAVTLLLAGPVLAGSTDTPVFPMTLVAPPVSQVAPAATDDWSGFYVGGAVSFDSAGNLQLISSDVAGSVPMADITSFGGFAGYNFQSDAFVYGGEFAVSSGGLTSAVPSVTHYEMVFDLKARAGYSFGNILTYGVVGGSYSNLHWNNVGAAFPSYGLAYGAGVEYLLGDHMIVGGEYLVRNLSGERNNGTGDEARITTQSAQLRVGWKF